MRIPHERPGIRGAFVKWLSVALLASGASMMGGSFSIWSANGKPFFFGGLALLIAGGFIEAGISGHLHDYLAWRRRYRFASREQERLRLQVETRIRDRKFDKDTLTAIGQLLDTEDDRYLDALSSSVAFIVAGWTDADDAMIHDLVWSRLGRFWHHSSLGALASLWKVLAKHASVGQSERLMDEISSQLQMRLQREIERGSIASQGEVDRLREAVEAHQSVSGELVLLGQLSSMREAVLNRQATTKLV